MANYIFRMSLLRLYYNIKSPQNLRIPFYEAGHEKV